MDRQAFDDLFMENLTTCNNLETIETVVVQAAKDFDLDCVYLFGSYAKNQQNKNSDIDLLVNKGSSKSFTYLTDFQIALQKKLNQKVHISEFYTISKNSFFELELIESIKLLYSKDQKDYEYAKRNENKEIIKYNRKKMLDNYPGVAFLSI